MLNFLKVGKKGWLKSSTVCQHPVLVTIETPWVKIWIKQQSRRDIRYCQGVWIGNIVIIKIRKRSNQMIWHRFFACKMMSVLLSHRMMFLSHTCSSNLDRHGWQEVVTFWPLNLSTRPSRQHDHQGHHLTHHIRSLSDWLPLWYLYGQLLCYLPNLRLCKAVRRWLNPRVVLSGVGVTAEEGASCVFVSVCRMHRGFLFGSFTSNMCKLFVQYMKVLRLKLSLLLSKTNKSHNWISATVSFVYSVLKIS